MKSFDSIESLAIDQGISERTGFRWLRSGKIEKRRLDDGRVAFILNDIPTDIDNVMTGDADISKRVATDKKNMSVVSKKSIGSGCQSFGRGEAQRVFSPGSLVQNLTEEKVAEELRLDIEKKKDEGIEYRERRDREKRERAEVDQAQRLEGLIVRESSRKQEERETSFRAVKQRIKNEILSSAWVDFLSPQYRGRLLVETEKALSGLDVEGIPFDELLTIAQGAADRVKEEASRERDRINREVQEKQVKEAIGYGETILRAIKIGAGMSSS